MSSDVGWCRERDSNHTCETWLYYVCFSLQHGIMVTTWSRVSPF
jgi:hypothetical protein